MSPTWVNTNFELSQIDGLEQRMQALIEKVRPKFESFGTYFVDFFSGKIGDEFYPLSQICTSIYLPNLGLWFDRKMHLSYNKTL